MAEWAFYYWLSLFLAALILILISLTGEISIRCLFGMHKDIYAGMKSGMFLCREKHKVVGTTKKLKQCVRCGRIK